MDCWSPISASTSENSGNSASSAGDGESGVGHEREQAGGLERDGFAAGVGAADEQARLSFVQLEGDRDDGPVLLAENGFEERMARFAQ